MNFIGVIQLIDDLNTEQRAALNLDHVVSVEPNPGMTDSELFVQCVGGFCLRVRRTGPLARILLDAEGSV